MWDSKGKCCDDDANEYYNDENAGCWNGNKFDEETLPTSGVIFYDKKFRGCTTNKELLDLKDSTTGDKLIKE